MQCAHCLLGRAVASDEHPKQPELVGFSLLGQRGMNDALEWHTGCPSGLNPSLLGGLL